MVACESVKDGRLGVLKASARDPGRVLNEGNYLSELRGRSGRLLGSPEGFCEVLVRPNQVSLKNLPSVRPAFFVEERVVGGSLQDYAVAGKCWSVAEVAMLGEQLVRRMQVMHTHENSLGLVHSDIK